MLRLVQHGVKGLLERHGHGLGQLPVHHAAAQGQQRPDGAALQHGAAHEFVSRPLVLGEIVAGPGVLRPVQAPGQKAAGVGVPVGRRLLEQLKALLPPSGAQVVVDVLEGPFHRVAEKPSHPYVLLPPRQA